VSGRFLEIRGTNKKILKKNNTLEHPFSRKNKKFSER
jgi:hypothetical protein